MGMGGKRGRAGMNITQVLYIEVCYMPSSLNSVYIYASWYASVHVRAVLQIQTGFAKQKIKFE